MLSRSSAGRFSATLACSCWNLPVSGFSSFCEVGCALGAIGDYSLKKCGYLRACSPAGLGPGLHSSNKAMAKPHSPYAIHPGPSVDLRSIAQIAMVVDRLRRTMWPALQRLYGVDLDCTGRIRRLLSHF